MRQVPQTHVKHLPHFQTNLDVPHQVHAHNGDGLHSM